VTEAQQLVSALLEAEDPKHFFRNRADLVPGLIPGEKEVEYQLIREPEYEGPEGHFGNEEDVQWVRDQLERGNEWAWFSADVVATWYDPVTEQEIEGHDYLGGCSYRSRADFMSEEPGSYWPDMKSEAYKSLVRNIESERRRAKARD